MILRVFKKEKMGEGRRASHKLIKEFCFFNETVHLMVGVSKSNRKPKTESNRTELNSVISVRLIRFSVLIRF